MMKRFDAHGKMFAGLRQRFETLKPERASSVGAPSTPKQGQTYCVAAWISRGVGWVPPSPLPGRLCGGEIKEHGIKRQQQRHHNRYNKGKLLPGEHRLRATSMRIPAATSAGVSTMRRGSAPSVANAAHGVTTRLSVGSEARALYVSVAAFCAQ